MAATASQRRRGGNQCAGLRQQSAGHGCKSRGTARYDVRGLTCFAVGAKEGQRSFEAVPVDGELESD